MSPIDLAIICLTIKIYEIVTNVWLSGINNLAVYWYKMAESLNIERAYKRNLQYQFKDHVQCPSF